jgi:hypothetical protein
MVDCTLVDFNILIQGERAPYTVIASYDNAYESGTFVPDVRAQEWIKAYQNLADSIRTADADAIMHIGSSLWGALMHGKVRDLWIAARTDVEHGHVEGLRMRLDLQAPHVSALPWESLYDPDRNIIFAAHPRYALVRVASIYRHVGPNRRSQVTLPLRMLIAAPNDPSGAINSEREIVEIRQIMETIGQKRIQVEAITGQISVTQLRAEIARVKPTILHFIGHGEPNGLRLWHRGQFEIVPAQSLRSVMERSPSVKLVFLNSCLAGRSARPLPFSSVPEQIMQAGVAAVIAMQFTIRDDVAIDFAHYLYAELLGGSCPGIIDLAVSAARSSLYVLNPGDFSFGTPVLWLNRKKGCIFSLPPASSEASSGEAEQEKSERASMPIKTPSLDLQDEGEWIDEMVANIRLEHLTGELAFLRSKWESHVSELRNLLLQLTGLAEQPNSSLYREKVTDYRRYKAALLRTKRLIEDALNEA